jgi:hypothetical protein
MSLRRALDVFWKTDLPNVKTIIYKGKVAQLATLSLQLEVFVVWAANKLGELSGVCLLPPNSRTETNQHAKISKQN